MLLKFLAKVQIVSMEIPLHVWNVPLVLSKLLVKPTRLGNILRRHTGLE